MKKLLYLLTIINIHLLTAMPSDIKPGNRVVLNQNQKLIPFTNLTEKLKQGEEVIFKIFPKYYWGIVHEVLPDVQCIKEDGTTFILEQYVIIHHVANDGKKEGSCHLTSALYKLQDIEK